MTPNMVFSLFAPFLLSRSALWHASARQNRCNLQRNHLIIALTVILHCQTSKQCTVGWRNEVHNHTCVILTRTLHEGRSNRASCEMKMRVWVFLNSRFNSPVLLLLVSIYFRGSQPWIKKGTHLFWMPETNRKRQVELENLVFELSGFNRNEQGAEMKRVLQMGVQNTPVSHLFFCIFFKFSKSDLSVWGGAVMSLWWFLFFTKKVSLLNCKIPHKGVRIVSGSKTKRESSSARGEERSWGRTRKEACVETSQSGIHIRSVCMGWCVRTCGF